MTEPLLDLLVVGAGPAGISVAVEARAAGIAASKILLFEKGEAHSWSIRKFYPEKKLVTANFKGLAAQCRGVLCIPDLSKGETLSYLDRAIRDHELAVRYREAVTAIAKQADGTFLVRTEKGTHRTRVCVIAIGILGKPNRPDYKIPPKVRARTHFDVTSERLEGERVLVVGGGDSASEYVQYLVQCGNEVTLSYRRSEFRRMTSLNRESLFALEERGQARILRASDIEGIELDEGRPHVRFTGASPPSETFDHIVFALGGATPAAFLQSVGIDFEGGDPRVTDGYETSIPGLYLIGDLAPETGSIILAFNSSRDAMVDICASHLECELPDRAE